MNRRELLGRLSTLALFSFVPPVSAQLPDAPVVYRKHLAPDAVEVVFSSADFKHHAGPFQLLCKGNALWVHKLEWDDNDGTRHAQSVRRNFPPGKTVELPAMPNIKNLTISITCLPLATATTIVELKMGVDRNEKVRAS
jgi:hypothetical protein